LSEKRQKNYREVKEDPEASVESIIKNLLKSNLKTRIVCINFVLLVLFLWFSSVGSGK
jgi:hypothetical protein